MPLRPQILRGEFTDILRVLRRSSLDGSGQLDDGACVLQPRRKSAQLLPSLSLSVSFCWDGGVDARTWHHGAEIGVLGIYGQGTINGGWVRHARRPLEGLPGRAGSGERDHRGEDRSVDKDPRISARDGRQTRGPSVPESSPSARGILLADKPAPEVSEGSEGQRGKAVRSRGEVAGRRMVRLSGPNLIAQAQLRPILFFPFYFHFPFLLFPNFKFKFPILKFRSLVSK
jgi:hypothetical protein